MSFKVSVQVKAPSRKQSITKISQQEYQIAVQAAPVAGKANKEVIELLARDFSVPPIIRESSSRSVFPKKAGRDRLTTNKVECRLLE
jgi:hypothetical protein